MKKILFTIFCVLFGIILLSASHEEYPDEYDSLVGGKYILQGKIPYKDWFQHHQPGAYVLASFLLPFSGTSFVKFRIALAVAYFAIHVGGYYILRKRFGADKTTFYILYLFLLAFLSTYFWGEMLLADTLAAYFLVPGFTYLLLLTLYNQKVTHKDVVTISVFTFLTWFTSMTYLYVIAGLVVYTFYIYYKSHEEKLFSFSLWKPVFIAFSIPYVTFFLFFLLTGSIKEYYFANITYNQNYYIYNYPHAPGQPVNPVRYAFVIANTFWNNYSLAMGGIKSFPLTDPLQTSTAFFYIALFIYVIVRKKYSFIFPLLVTMVYVCARSNPQQVKETDYQAAAYLLIGLASGTFLLFDAKRHFDSEGIKRSDQLVVGALFLFVGVYWIATAFYAQLRFMQRFYPKYMGEAPYIYDRPDIAPIVNKIVDDTDFVWIGPFEFKELFYLKTKRLPSKYHWFLQHAATSKIHDELMTDFVKNKPKVVVFNRKYSPWGGDPGGFNYFMVDYLDKEYIRLYKYNDTLTGYYYKWKVGNPMNHDLDDDFNFDKASFPEMLQRLLDQGLIEKVNR